MKERVLKSIRGYKKTMTTGDLRRAAKRFEKEILSFVDKYLELRAKQVNDKSKDHLAGYKNINFCGARVIPWPRYELFWVVKSHQRPSCWRSRLEIA